MGGFNRSVSAPDPDFDKWVKGGISKCPCFWTKRGLRTRGEYIIKTGGRWEIHVSRRVAGPFPTLKAAKVAYLMRLSAGVSNGGV